MLRTMQCPRSAGVREKESQAHCFVQGQDGRLAAYWCCRALHRHWPTPACSMASYGGSPAAPQHKHCVTTESLQLMADILKLQLMLQVLHYRRQVLGCIIYAIGAPVLSRRRKLRTAPRRSAGLPAALYTASTSEATEGCLGLVAVAWSSAAGKCCANAPLLRRFACKTDALLVLLA